jgi:A/G-specific adenine glycosylase
MTKRAQNSTPQRKIASAPLIRAALLPWYRTQQRRLPWRESPSLYKTVVSEFMLQQTQVETVLPYFARWLQKFPDFATLAKARESDVLKMWEGLGYYRRARLLHELARAWVKLSDKPQSTEDWLELPGVGPYTAAAISSIAFGAHAAVVDGNVVRVLARIMGEPTLFKDGSAAVKFFTDAANELLDVANPGDHNQAMMELGATVCTRRNPQCLICPVRTWCVAAAKGEMEDLPRFVAKKMKQTELVRLWIERDSALLLHRRESTAKRMANLCELPDAASLPNAIIEKKPLAIKRRTIANEQFTESIHRATLREKLLEKDSGLLWASTAQLKKLTLSGPHRKWIEELRA